MPQMSPLMWEILFIVIFMMMIVTTTKTYFFNNNFGSDEYKKMFTEMNQKSWKW